MIVPELVPNVPRHVTGRKFTFMHLTVADPGPTAVDCVPAGQSVHAVAVVVVEYLPAGQFVHVPAIYWPIAQAAPACATSAANTASRIVQRVGNMHAARAC